MTKTVAAAMMLLLFATVALGAEPFSIATGPKNLTYYPFGQDIQRACPNLPISIEETAGSISNLSLIGSSKKVRFGITQQDALEFRALTNKKQTSNIVVILPLYDNEIHLIARTDSGINGINDLANRNVNMGPNNSGGFVTGKMMKMKTGIKWNEFSFDNKEAMSKLISGEIDAMILMAGKPIPQLVELGSKVDGVIKLVPIKHKALDGFYTPIDIPEGLYAWQNKPVQTYAVKNVLVGYNYRTADKIKEVEDLVSCYVKALPELQDSGHSKQREVDVTDRSVQWPMHEAARRMIDRLTAK